MSKILFGDALYIKGRIGWQTLKKEEYLDNGDYYLVTGVDITDEHRIDFSKCYYVDKVRYEMDDKIQLQNGDIIVTKDGTIGKIALIDKLDKPATLNSHLFLIRNLKSDVLDNQFLFYILRSERFQKYASNNTSGSNIPAFTQKNISEFEVDLPPIKTQQKVANILKSIDDKIINNNAINAELEAMAKTIYDYWFLQFEFPDENGKPYKSSGGKMVYNEELKREIPEGWDVAKVIDCVDMVNGYPFSSDDYVPDGPYKLYTIKNVQDGHIVADVDNYIDSLPDKLPDACILEPSDIIMSLTGNVGRVGLVYENNALLNQRVVKLVPHNHHIAYTYLLFRDGYMKTRMDNLAIGAAQKNLSPVNVGNLLVQVPSEILLQSFDKICNPIVEKIVKNYQENQELASLRDFLLPLLMNGQVGFKD